MHSCRLGVRILQRSVLERSRIGKLLGRDFCLMHLDARV